MNPIQTESMRAVRALLLCGVGLAATAFSAHAEEAAGEDEANPIVVTGSRPIAESEAAALEI